MKLTQTAVNKLTLPRGKPDAIFFDDDLRGFGLRIREGGSRKWIVHYRQGGIQRRHTIGPAAVLSVEEARKRARKILVAVDDGRDPASEKANKRAAAGLLFGAVVDDYLAVRRRDMRPRTHVETTRYLKAEWKPQHGLALSAVTRPVIAANIRKMAERGPVAANRARASLSALYVWAIGEGLCDNNPVMGTNKATEEKPRERVLTDAELVAIWNALPDGNYGRLVKLLMLTGCRREEIGGLRWSEVNLERRQIELPANRTKNGRPHDIPLSNLAADILNMAHRRGEFVFGFNGRGFTTWTHPKKALDAAVRLPPWTLHDLRRTAATKMADLGVQPHIIEAALNHVSGHKAGVAGIYNRSAYTTEKRAALELWANHIKVALARAEGANVVGLTKARA